MELFAAARAAFPAGTSFPCFNATAPLFWTKQTTHDDKALRLVTGTPASGGSVAFSTVHAKAATDSFTLLDASSPGLTIAVPVQSGQAPAAGVNSRFVKGNSSTGSSSPLNAASNGSDGAHNHGIDFRVAYVDVIMVNKD